MAKNLAPKSSCAVEHDPESVFACEVIRDETAGFVNSLDYMDPKLTFLRLAGVAGKIRCILTALREEGRNVVGLNLDRSDFEVTSDIYSCVTGIIGDVRDRFISGA